MSLVNALPTKTQFEIFLASPDTTREALIESADEVAKNLFLDFQYRKIRTTGAVPLHSLDIFVWAALDMMKIDRGVLADLMDVNLKNDQSAYARLAGYSQSYGSQIARFLYPSSHNLWNIDTSDIGYKVNARKEAGLMDGRTLNGYYNITIPKKAFQEFAEDPHVEIALRLEMNRVFRRAGDREFAMQMERGAKAPEANERELREALVDVIRESLGPKMHRSNMNLALRSMRRYDKLSPDEMSDLMDRAMANILDGR